MQKNIQLSIANPCSESWDQMSPNTQGRFCGSCQKTVVDFTSMTDQDLLKWFARREGSVCGRLTPDQLHRPLIARPERKKGHWHYWQYLIAGLLFSSEISAQTRSNSPTITQQLPARPESSSLMGDTIIAAEKPSPNLYRGRVVDSLNRPIGYATITINARQGVAADADGYFSIPENLISKHQLLKISAVGYENITINVDQLMTKAPLTIYPIVMMDRVVVLGGVVAVVRSKKKRRPLADTVSLFKDTLTTVGLAKSALTAYPNPVARGTSLNLSARLDQAGTYKIQLFSSSGVLVESMEVPADRESNTNPISMLIPGALVPGAYFIRLSHPALAKCYSQEIMVF